MTGTIAAPGVSVTAPSRRRLRNVATRGVLEVASRRHVSTSQRAPQDEYARLKDAARSLGRRGLEPVQFERELSALEEALRERWSETTSRRLVATARAAPSSLYARERRAS